MNVWTWDAANQYFLSGLTAPDNKIRNQNLSNLFSMLGHLTHLVAEMSVPEHSRNYFHCFWNFEDWCRSNLKDLNAEAYGLKAFRYDFAPPRSIYAQYQAHIDPGNISYEDYASNLVPRAVSYGTALVDYFLRGKFEVIALGS